MRSWHRCLRSPRSRPWGDAAYSVVPWLLVVMELFGKDLNDDIVVIAEIGVNHEGDLAAASRLLSLAAAAGADAVKFQSYTPERLTSAADPDRLARVRRFALDESAHRSLARQAADLGVVFLSTAVTEDWVPLLSQLCPAIKIASGDLTFEPVVRAAAAAGKPVLLSTGLGTVKEIDQAVAWVRDEVEPVPLEQRLVLMHCVSAYPTPLEDANVRSVPFLAERFRVPVGYSNHVIGLEACYASVALGAQVIEIHFTDCKSGREFHDHALSVEPDELRSFVATAPRVRSCLGRFAKERQPSEQPNLVAVRKGVVARSDLPAGTILSRENLMFARPASEFAANEIGSIIGRRLTVDCRQGDLIRRGSVA